MSVVASDRSPASGTKNTDGVESLSITWGSFGAPLYICYIFYRRNGGSWTSKISHYGTAYEATQTVGVSVGYGDYIEWYGRGYDANMEYAETSVWSLYREALPPDTTDPSIGSVTPSAGNVAPSAGGTVTFQATVTDDQGLAEAKLYVDGALQQTWLTDGILSYTKVLTKGVHTYEWTAEDASGNTSATGTVNITVTNVVPVVPAGTVTVAGETGAVEVANLGNVWISWPEFLDYNAEDTLNYTAEYQIASGGWHSIVSGSTATTVEWTPSDGIGAAEIRVKANDGTGDSSYLTRAGITVLSSQSPNAPTITSPTGGEEWREGETKNITWTVASPEHPEGLPCTYEIQFSALGDFSDAVTLTVSADGGTYPWTLATDLV